MRQQLIELWETFLLQFDADEDGEPFFKPPAPTQTATNSKPPGLAAQQQQGHPQAQAQHEHEHEQEQEQQTAKQGQQIQGRDAAGNSQAAPADAEEIERREGIEAAAQQTVEQEE